MALRLRSVPLLLLALCVSATQGEDWPQFRGPNCAGISTSRQALPTKFSLTENLKWSAELGDGIGCPIVAGGRVFTTAMVDEHTVGLHAFDAKTGKAIWSRKWETGLLSEVHKTNSHASTTPAADSERVYFYFSSLGLITVDAKTGKDVWKKKLPKPYFVFKWGPGMSPIVYKDKVIFLQDDDLNPAIYAFEKTTGKLVWKDKRDDHAVNYSHPVINRTAKGDELVVAGTGMLIGYDLDSGERKWTARVLLRNIKTTPVAKDGVIYIALQSGGIANQWLATADRSETGNNDGKLTKEEMQGFVGKEKIPESFFKKTFDRGDLNKDGLLEGKELDIAFLHPDNFAGATFDKEEAAEQYIMAVRGGGSGDVTQTHVLWRHPTKFTDHIVSPLVVNDQMFLVKGGGIGTCFDTKKGKAVWGPKRIQNSCEYFASPIFGDGKIYMAGENGVLVVLESRDKLTVLAKNDLEDPILGTPAIADGTIFVRTRGKLLAFAK